MFDWKRVNEADNSSLIFDCEVDVMVFSYRPSNSQVLENALSFSSSTWEFLL